MFYIINTMPKTRRETFHVNTCKNTMELSTKADGYEIFVAEKLK